MTPDELQAAVEHGEVERAIEMVMAASEDERRTFAPRALALRKAYGDWRSLQRGGPVIDRRRNEASLLALYGTGSAAQIRAGRRMWSDDAALRILRQRPPDLLVDLAPWMLETFGWRTVRGLVREGVIPRPETDAYISGMLAHFLDPKELLAEDPGLLDHEVWRLFEVEGTADHSLADHDKYSRQTWQDALLEVAAAGGPERARLLDSSLAALERDFPAFKAGWFSRFHEALKPTIEERAERAPAYLRLLRSPVPATVAMAVDALTALQRHDVLDREAALRHLAPALTARAASTAKAALKLLAGASAFAPAPAASVAVDALAHPSADVQSAALALLERLAAGGAAAPSKKLRDVRSEVAASLLPRLDALLGRVPPHESAAVELSDPEPAPESPDARVADPFAALRPVVPVANWGELVELIAQVLERGGPAEDVERLLDGVARLSSERPPDFDRLARSVRVRAEKIRARQSEWAASRWGEYSDVDVGVNIATLVRSVIDGSRSTIRDWEPSLGRYLACRVAEVADWAARRTGEPLLAAPTHEGGWIEPAVLVERLACRQRLSRSKPEIYRLDLIQALLRLLPVRRDEAVAAARTLSGEEGLAVRYALGEQVAIGRSRGLWVAAARSRRPDGDDPAVDRAHAGLGAEAALAGEFRVAFVRDRHDLHPPQLVVTPRVGDRRIELPTQLLAVPAAQRYTAREEQALVEWMQLIWPQSRRSWFGVTAAMMLWNLDWWEAAWPNRSRLQPLFEPWTAIGREAALCIAVALQAKEPGERGLAVDAAIALIGDGRLTPELLAGGLRELGDAAASKPAGTYNWKALQPQRLASSLAGIARSSRRHAVAAREVAAASLDVLVAPRPSAGPVGQLTPILRLLVELHAQSEAPVAGVARPTLELLATRSGECSRLARELLGARTSI